MAVSGLRCSEDAEIFVARNLQCTISIAIAYSFVTTLTLTFRALHLVQPALDFLWLRPGNGRDLACKGEAGGSSSL